MKDGDSAKPNSAPAADAQPAKGRFENKVALVTGASDQGIGGAIAERLVRDGADVALVARHEPKRLVKKLRRLGRRVNFTLCDITKQDEVQRAVDDCMGQFGKLDILVNNAGIEVAKPLAEFTDEEWISLLDVNLHGAIRMIRATLAHLTAPGGAIVNVASALALGGCPSFSIYSASKAGMVGLTQSLAWELAPRGIRVVAVAPGMVHTPMIHKHIEHLSKATWQKILDCHPLGMGMPHDVAAAVTFLASDDARWITGVTLPLGWAQHYPLPVEQFLQ
jgi:3-oxoacyl-[acyl-carrier protein] reductase